MNIKNFASTTQLMNGITSTQAVNSKDRAIKSESTHDRDANGQSLYEKQKKKNKMSKEQAEKALELLNAKTFMTDMSWLASLIEEEGFFYAEIRDKNNDLIRRISESALWELFEETSISTTNTKGNLLNRSA